MGLFSWDCNGCGHPLVGDFMTKRRKGRWMSDAVGLDAYGDVARGAYNGYGRITGAEGDVDIGYFDGLEVWHRKCWDAAGQPSWSGSSHDSECQGYFCNHNYTFPPPETFEHYPRAPKSTKKPRKGSAKRRIEEHAAKLAELWKTPPSYDLSLAALD